MPNLRIGTLEGRPLLDVASYGRRGPGHGDRFSPEELALIGRTVRRTPEVMVKVLPRDGNNLRSVVRHLNYIGRGGELELEAENGDRVQGSDAGERLVEDWDLDLDQDRRDAPLTAGAQRAPKLVHKIVLSMPPGTPASGVLQASRNFAREEFGLKHRYVLVLHSDEPHPHVHLVVKAVSEEGERLNIRKATLREWRREFAKHLREQGIDANATERAVRGEARTHKSDGIYRASLRGESTHMRARADAVSCELLNSQFGTERGKSKLVETRRAVEHGWGAATAILVAQGHRELAARVHRFLSEMPDVRTEREQMAEQLCKRFRNREMLVRA